MGFKSHHVDSNIPWKSRILYGCGTWHVPRREEHGISLWTRPRKEVLRPNKELAKSSHLRFYVTSHLRFGLFHSLFPIKICKHFSLPPHVPYVPAHLTVLDTIMGIFGEEYNKIELIVLRFSPVSNLQLLPPSCSQISSSAPHYNTTSEIRLCVSYCWEGESWHCKAPETVSSNTQFLSNTTT